MSKINWSVRLKNKMFWVAIIPALALLAQQVAAIFGFTIDLNDISGKVMAALDTVFVILVILGVVADPTTEGVSDSNRALGYTAPAPSATDVVSEN